MNYPPLVFMTSIIIVIDIMSEMLYVALKPKVPK